MFKHDNPDLGCQWISDALFRGPALSASPSAVARVLHEAGYELEESPTHPHPDRSTTSSGPSPTLLPGIIWARSRRV